MSAHRRKAKYSMSALISKYYKSWINGSTLLGHQNDLERFYKFVKACIRYGRNSKDGNWLRYFLDKDLKAKYDKKYYDEVSTTAVSIFDHIMDYHKIVFPDHFVEMRNPIYVGSELRRLKKENDEPFMSEVEIDKLLQKNFGDKWRENC